MSKPTTKRPPSTRKRMILMLVAALVIFGGVFGIKAMIGAQTNKFFDNMPQPAVAVSSANASTQAWSDAASAKGGFAALSMRSEQGAAHLTGTVFNGTSDTLPGQLTIPSLPLGIYFGLPHTLVGCHSRIA